MGHSIEHYTFPEKTDRDAIWQRMNDIAEKFSCDSGGLYGHLEFLSRPPFPNEEAAREYIEKHDYSYRQVAVRFIAEEKAPKPTKAYTELERRLAEAEREAKDKEARVHYKAGNVKSAFVSCPRCASKLATKYIKSNECPLCSKDLRPQSTLDSIEAANKKVKDLKKKLREVTAELQKRPKTKPVIKWLVKIEYHV